MHKKSLIVFFSLLLAISGLMYTSGAVLQNQRDALTNEAGNGANAETIETRLVGTSTYAMGAAGDPIITPNNEILSTSSPAEMTSESIETASGTTGFTNDTPPPQTFEEWRNFLLAWNNVTLDDLEKANPITIDTLNQEARIYEGWSNGTYTEEQATQMLSELHHTPTVEDVSYASLTDQSFEYSFNVNNLIFGEHTFRVYTYLDIDTGDAPWLGYDAFWDEDEEKIYGPFVYFPVNDPYPYDTLPYLSELDPHSYVGVTMIPPHDDNQIGWYHGHEGWGIQGYTGQVEGMPPGGHHFVVMILWKHDIFIEWTFTYKAHYVWTTSVFEVTTYDDDTTPPFIVNAVVFSAYDNKESLLVRVAATDASGIEPAIGFNLGVYGSWYADGYYWALVPSPRVPGFYLAVITVWDADYDRPGDRLFAFQLCGYWILDDDVNPPEVSWSTTDIRWSGDMIQLSFTVGATDARGIASVAITIAGYIFTNLGPHTVTLPPGQYIAHVSVTDGDNDWSGDSLETSIDVPIVLDLSPPTTELAFEPSYNDGTRCYVTSATLFTLSATDDVTGVANTYYQINGGEWIEYTTGFMLSGPDGYTYTISYYSVDNNGNVELTKTQTVVIDNTAPVTKLTVSGEHGFGKWYVSDVEVTLSPTDGLSGVAHTKYSLDGSNWLEYTGPFAYGFEGDTTLYYRSIDNLGNAEDVKTKVLSIDCTAPETTIGLSGTEGLEDWYVSDVTVTLSATDTTSGVARIMYSFDGDTWYAYYYTPYGTTLIIDSPSDEQWCPSLTEIAVHGVLQDETGAAVVGETVNLYVRTWDSTGWTEWAYLASYTPTYITGEWIFYVYPNYIAPVGPGETAVAQFKVEFVGTATYGASSAESDCITICYEEPPPIIIIGSDSLNTATTASLSTASTGTVLDSPGPFTITDEGVTTIYYYSVDAAGNQGDLETATIKIDKTAPETTESHTGTEGLGGWYTSDVTVTLEAADPVPGSGLARTEYSYDEENWMTYTSFLTLTSEGSTTIYYRSVDIAGNTETAQSIEIWIDKTPPATTKALEGEHGLGEWFTSDVTVTLSAADPTPGSGLAYTNYSLDLITWTRYETPFIISYRDITTVYYRSVDNAGNIGQTESVQVKIYIASQTAIGPATLNLKSNGQWVTLYIQLPQDYSTGEINISSFELRFGDQVVQASWGEVQDGLLMLKFDRAALINMLSGLQRDTLVQLELWGEVAGSVIAGTVTVRVI